MKKYIIILTLACSSLFAHSQTWSEWFRQKKTQISYLGTQIAALKIYGGYVAKGYGVTKIGLTTIGATKRADLSMHDDYFASLQRLNPAIKNYHKVAGIINLQIRMVKAYGEQQKEVMSSSHLTPDEKEYINKVIGQLLLGCVDIIDKLLMVTTDRSVQLKDDERIRIIDQLFSDMQQRSAFLQSFGSQTNQLAVQRMREAADIKTSRSLRCIQ